MATGTSLSTYTENETLDHWFGGATAPVPSTLYFALFTAAPNDDGGGTEVTGGAYARVSKTNNLTNFPAASGGTKYNGTDVDFGSATADWGTVTHFGVFDAATNGNLIAWGALDASRLVKNGDSCKFGTTAPNRLTFALD